MKSTVRTIILVAASVFATISCQKEAAVSEPQNPVNAGETIQVNINASLGDLVAADGTKATAESVVRLKWAEGDKVQAYCGANKIGTDLTVTPSANGLFASLTGTITAPETNETITFVYSRGCTVATDGLTFDFSNQTTTNGIPFVAYATLMYDGTATFTDKMVGFKFATSVMKIAATNLGGGAISNATISGINTKVTLTLSASSDPTINGNTAGNIETTNIAASSDKTRAIITVGLVPDNSTGRNITVTQTGYTNKGVITPNEIQSNKSYTTPTSLFTCGTLGTGANVHAYVLIAGTKWATQNLAVSESGETAWMSESVNVPGTTDEKVQIGDYFQWGATKNYTTEENNDKGLLIYKSFTNDGSSGSFSWKKNASDADYQFNTSSICPHYSSSYDKYNSSDGIVTLIPSDDVASILWGDTWRMPTSAEFQALFDATYWAWDETDKGQYVYAPQEGDAGRNNITSNTYNKSNALLFFPAAGEGNGASLGFAGYWGSYWSSSLFTDNPRDAYLLDFGGGVRPRVSYDRCRGYSVRPVSD